jgi:hypothetical protein
MSTSSSCGPPPPTDQAKVDERREYGWVGEPLNGHGRDPDRTTDPHRRQTLDAGRQPVLRQRIRGSARGAKQPGCFLDPQERAVLIDKGHHGQTSTARPTRLKNPTRPIRSTGNHDPRDPRSRSVIVRDELDDILTRPDRSVSAPVPSHTARAAATLDPLCPFSRERPLRRSSGSYVCTSAWST